MAITEVINNSGEVITEIGKLGNWIQGIGLVIVLWIIFQVISLIVNRKKRRALYRIEKDLKRIESKIALLWNL